MKLNNIKLIVSDMDGTLLNSKHQLPSNFEDIYKLLEAQNIKFVAASGRQYYSIIDKFEHFTNNITIVAENGAYIKSNTSEIAVHKIPKAKLNSIISFIRTIPNTYLVLCGKKQAYIEQHDAAFVSFFKEFYNAYQIVDAVLCMEDDFFKIALYNPNGAEENIYPFLNPFKTAFQIKVSGYYWVDVMQLNINKGTALEQLQTIWHISKEETLVFGDYLNDLELFKQATYSVAMENAHSAIKGLASYQTKSNDENGVVDFIQKNILE
ncbi:Probable hydrolase (HAD superfamily) [Flavobacterium indicum GPTSA100-9 = DSM 17447]|uniref:Probable hydrolase (HAD superfamily) n=1 Tax=Flavobacterium indicum (strain DSM 17447 / CIP 109464 / GPTSA100-9) TaxID=1094466 RepID=H8XU88_FLAIG|nr:Cof-type HAD-IIB family hydrolase [Flavobacterium indicum]CCG52871.1 Probable hydrolase (HAD superfamily) [Flavobacterium indicum GPTSA100-9 = DSM 17447]